MNSLRINSYSLPNFGNSKELLERVLFVKLITVGKLDNNCSFLKFLYMDYIIHHQALLNMAKTLHFGNSYKNCVILTNQALVTVFITGATFT